MYLTQSDVIRGLSKEEYSILWETCQYSNNLYNVALYNIRQYYFQDKKFLKYEDNVQNFSHIFLGLARLNSPLPEIRPSWEAFAHPRSGCLLWFLVTKRILSTHETSSHEDSAPTDHFRRAGARASKCPAGAELLKGRLVQRPHIKIAFSPPFMARDVPQSRAYQH